MSLSSAGEEELTVLPLSWICGATLRWVKRGEREGSEGTGKGKKGMGKNTSKINFSLWPRI